MTTKIKPDNIVTKSTFHFDLSSNKNISNDDIKVANDIKHTVTDGILDLLSDLPPAEDLAYRVTYGITPPVFDSQASPSVFLYVEVVPAETSSIQFQSEAESVNASPGLYKLASKTEIKDSLMVSVDEHVDYIEKLMEFASSNSISPVVEWDHSSIRSVTIGAPGDFTIAE